MGGGGGGGGGGYKPALHQMYETSKVVREKLRESLMGKIQDDTFVLLNQYNGQYCVYIRG